MQILVYPLYHLVVHIIIGVINGNFWQEPHLFIPMLGLRSVEVVNNGNTSGALEFLWLVLRRKLNLGVLDRQLCLVRVRLNLAKISVPALSNALWPLQLAAIGSSNLLLSGLDGSVLEVVLL